MKKIVSVAAALMFVTTMLAAIPLAQSKPVPAKPAATAQQPAAPAPAATGPQTAKPPEAKTPEEFKAYQAAVAVTDPVAAEAAVDEFAKTHPTSELRVPAYSLLLQKAYEKDDAPKIVGIGRKVLAIEPDNAMTQVVTATALAETTRETDLDYAVKTQEATKHADGALKSIETMLPQPNVSPDQFETLKNMLRGMAYSAKGYMAMNRRDFVSSEDNFQKAINANPSQADSTLYLRLAVAQDSLRKYAPAFANANKALQLAETQNNTTVANYARNERDRLQKLMGSAAAPKPATPPKQ